MLQSSSRAACPVPTDSTRQPTRRVLHCPLHQRALQCGEADWLGEEAIRTGSEAALIALNDSGHTRHPLKP